MSAAPSGGEKKAFVVDGSVLEGGGQILRNSIAYAALLGYPLEIENIRAGRSKPGLRPQHLTGIQLTARMVGGTLEGDKVQSMKIKFQPGKTKPDQKEFSADTKTAGSVCLLMQTVLPLTLFRASKTTTTLKGGTNAIKAPLIEFSSQVLLPFLYKHMAINISASLDKRGLFPRGGGVVRMNSEPVKGGLKSFEVLKRGNVTEITGTAIACGKLPLKMAQEMVEGATKHLKWYFSSSTHPDVKINIKAAHEPHPNSSGTFMLLTAITDTGCVIASSGLGERGKRASNVGHGVGEDLVGELKAGGCVDSHMQDQLILFMALASGTSKLLTGPLTLHTRTAIYLAERLTGAKFVVTPVADDGKEVLPEVRFDPDSGELRTREQFLHHYKGTNE